MLGEDFANTEGITITLKVEAVPNTFLLEPTGNSENNQQAMITFAPIREFVIYDKVESGDYLIDFDRGITLSMPKDFEWNSENALKWIGENGVDAGGATQEAIHGLIGWDIVFIPCSNDYWETAKADSLFNQQAWQLLKEGGSQVYMTAKGELPQTYMFKTREGGIGILQILGFTNNPKGVRIHYKIIRKAGVQNEIEKTTGQSKPQIILQADVFTVKTSPLSVNEFLEKEFGIKDSPLTELTDTQAEKFKEWAASIPGANIASSPRTIVFDGESSKMSITTQTKYKTGVEIEYVPIYKKSENKIHLSLNINNAIATERKSESGDYEQNPIINRREISTKIAISRGKYCLFPIAGMMPLNVANPPETISEQTILLIKADVQGDI